MCGMWIVLFDSMYRPCPVSSVGYCEADPLGNGGNIVIHTFLIVTSILQVIFLCL